LGGEIEKQHRKKRGGSVGPHSKRVSKKQKVEKMDVGQGGGGGKDPDSAKSDVDGGETSI